MRGQKWISIKVAILIALTITVLLCLLVWQSWKTDYGVNVDSVQWLPSEAHSITYMKMPGFNTIAEFEISQAALEKWCADVNKPLKKLGPIEKGSVPRCLHRLEKRGIIPTVPEPNDSRDWKLWYQGRYEKSLANGDLYYEDRWSNGGGYIIGYDVDEGMGYYWYGHH